MSHFTVMVIGEDPEGQLAPYSVDFATPYSISKERIIKETREDIERYKNTFYKEYKKNPKQYEENCKNKGHLNYIKNKFPEKLKWTDEECYQEGLKWYEKDNIQEDGSVIDYYNPKAKWDWYLLGGRWIGYFKLKPGAKGRVGTAGLMAGIADPGTADQAYKKDIDFKGMKEDAARKAEKRYKYVEREFGGKIPKLDYSRQDIQKKIDNGMTKIDGKNLYYSQDAVKQFKNIDRDKFKEIDIFLNLERYQCTLDEFKLEAEKAAIIPFAVLDHGDWHENAEMGSWGISYNEKERKLWQQEVMDIINRASENTLISLYDCHS